MIGPRFVNLDVGVLKDTTLRESLRLQFRGEFFNIMNHTNFALPNAALFVGGGSTPGGSLADYTGRKSSRRPDYQHGRNASANPVGVEAHFLI